MKTEKQIRARLKELVEAHYKCVKNTDSNWETYEYLIGMITILEWVLEYENG